MIGENYVSPIVQLNNDMVSGFRCSKLEVNNSVMAKLSCTFQSLIVEMFS